MSNNLVRKLLRATNDYDDTVEPQSAEATKKRRRKGQEETKNIASEQDVVDWQVRNMLALDRSMAARNKEGQKSRQPLEKKDSKRRKKAHDIILLNRTSAAQAHKVPEPTFNKKKYKKEQKEASIRKIAKLLQKRTSKT